MKQLLVTCLCVAWISLVASSAQAQTVALKDIVPDYMEGDLEIAITPTPQQAELKATAFPAGKVLLVHPDGCKAPDALAKELKALLGADVVQVSTPAALEDTAAATVILAGNVDAQPWPNVIRSAGLGNKLYEAKTQGPDAYVIYTAAGKLAGKNVVLLAGNTPAADFWAFATLRQMTFTKDGTQYMREGTILDFPRFPKRGNKRPRQWEWRYKANYGWGFVAPRQNSERNPQANFRWDYFRSAGAWLHHGEPLKATDAEMDALVAGYDYQDKAGKTRHTKGAKEYYDQGCREFVLKFDDAGWKLSKPTKEQFGTGNDYQDYFKALNGFLRGMHQRLKAMGSGVQVFFMPRPYWANSYELKEFAEAVRAPGALPKDMGLSVCGPEVISWSIPTLCMKDYREIFGFEGKAQIYDNFGRGGELFAYHGRDADLWKEVECIFPERGTPVTRITVYDYLWNPEHYDPVRSLKLAIRELSNRDPALYKAMWDFVSYWNENRDPQGYPPRQALVESRDRITAAMKQKFDAVVPLLERSPLAKELDLDKEFFGFRHKIKGKDSYYEWGEYARLARRAEFDPYMKAYAWQEAKAVPTREAITVDGKLDEPAWQQARQSAPFVKHAWGSEWGANLVLEPLESYTLPPEEATHLRVLYSKTHLYLALDFKYKKKPQLPKWATELWKDKKTGERVHFAWRVPCFEVFLDVTGRREHYYQIVSNIAGLWLSTHCRAHQTRKTGGWWKPDWHFMFTLGDTEGVLEASVPLQDLTNTMPTKGTAWGCQIFRSKIGAFSLFSGSHDMVGGEHGSREFGRIVFE